MMAVFNDLQDYSSNLNGVSVRNTEDLYTTMESVRFREPFVCDLEGENGYKLTMGIGNDVGFVQHGSIDSDSPYLAVIAPCHQFGECDKKQDYVEFLCGNTPTPISSRYILPLELVKQIVAHFIETGERIATVIWEEI